MLRAQLKEPLNNRPLMLLLATALAWCLLLCPSLSLAMQAPATAGDGSEQHGDASEQVIDAGGGCHSRVVAADTTPGNDHGSCDNCQAAEQIPGDAPTAQAVAHGGFIAWADDGDNDRHWLAAHAIPPDHPPLFLLHGIFLI